MKVVFGRTRTGRRGLTLTELLISLGVFTVGVVGIMALFGVGLDAHRRAASQTRLAMVSERILSDVASSLGNISFGNIPPLNGIYNGTRDTTRGTDTNNVNDVTLGLIADATIVSGITKTDTSLTVTSGDGRLFFSETTFAVPESGGYLFIDGDDPSTPENEGNDPDATTWYDEWVSYSSRTADTTVQPAECTFDGLTRGLFGTKPPSDTITWGAHSGNSAGTGQWSNGTRVYFVYTYAEYPDYRFFLRFTPISGYQNNAAYIKEVRLEVFVNWLGGGVNRYAIFETVLANNLTM